MEKQLCIVLRAVNYRDSDRILSLLSREEGLLTAQARGVRGIKSKLKAAAQPMCCAEYEFFQKKDRLFVTDALIKEEFYNLQKDYDKYAVACVMLELAEKIAEHSLENERLFLSLVHALHAMEKNTLNAGAALSYFMVAAVYILGIFPSIGNCAVCGNKVEKLTWWSAEQGGAVCEKCAEGVAAKTIKAGLPQLFLLTGAARPSAFAKLQEDLDGKCGDFNDLLYDYLLLAGDIKLKTYKYLPAT